MEKRKKVKKEWRRRTREKAVRCEVDEKVMMMVKMICVAWLKVE